MLDDFLKDLGVIIVDLVKTEIITPRPRFSKSPRQMKRNSPYDFKATGRGYNSVSYEVIDDQLFVLMEDYMVDYVFGDGSFPGGGKWAGRDTRPKGSRSKKSALIDALTKWAMAKLNLPQSKAKGMAFAVRKNLYKSGYAGYNYQTDKYNQTIAEQIELLLQSPRYVDSILDTDIQEVVDRINTLGQQTFNIALGR